MNGIIRPFYDVIKDQKTGYFVSLKKNSKTNGKSNNKRKKSSKKSKKTNKRVVKSLKWLTTTKWYFIIL